jgi:hypothetical protein
MTIGMVCSADLADFVAVKAHTVAGQVAVCAAVTDVPMGVVERAAKSGMPVNVVIGGTAKIKAGAALATIGVPVTTDASGRAVAGGASDGCIGILLSTAGAANEIVEVLLMTSITGYTVTA